MTQNAAQNTDELMVAIGTIYAVTVLLDRRERDQELIEFTHAVMTINQRLRPGKILPRATILSWYHSQSADLAARLKADTDDSWKTSILEKIQDDSIRRLVLASIFAICICDYELRDEEADFIKIALNIWNKGLPSMEELEMLAS